jgi:nuclear protein localization protein 4 homolog
MAQAASVATKHDLSETYQLMSTSGWQTLEAILQSSGENIPKRDSNSLKRPRPPSGDKEGAVAAPQQHHHHLHHQHLDLPQQRRRDPTSGEPVTKRMAGLRLTGEKPTTDNDDDDVDKSDHASDESPRDRPV